MKYLSIAFMAMICCLQAMAQPNITRVEYFFNTDPGMGNGNPIPISPSANVANITTPINIAGLAPGLHTLFIRSRNTDGKWSITNRSQILIKPNIAAPVAINKMEYFFDADPGAGLGTNIPINSAIDLSNQIAPVNIDALGDGLHILFIRSRNADGKWSITNRSMILIKKASPGTNITAVEYFIDTDPGTGNATPLALNPQNPLATFAAPVNISGLAVGDHRLFIRSRNAQGKWSITNNILFPISATAATPYINVTAVTKKQLCASDFFVLSFDAKGSFNAGNQFTIQLSDASGSFTSPVSIGSFTGTTSSLVYAGLPRRLPDGNNYRVRVSSSNPAVTGVASDTLFSLRDRPDLGPDTLAAIVCLGETVNLNPLYNTTGLTATWNTANTITAPQGMYILQVVNTAGCRDTAIAIVGQDVNTWTGIQSNNWHTAANWSRGKTPSEKTHVIIPAATPNPCVISVAEVQVSSLQVRTGAIIQVLNNKKITVLANCNVLPQGD